MRYFFFSLIVAGWLLTGCSGSKDTTDSEPAAEEEQVAEEEEPVEEEEEPPAVPVSPIVGEWEGPLANPNGSTLRVVFHITQDNAGNLTAATDAAGTTTMTYDPATDLLTRIEYPDGKFFNYDYDSAGQNDWAT